MTNIHRIIGQIGSYELAKALGCGTNAIELTANRGYFPTSWYPTVQKLSLEHRGQAVPMHYFNWKQPSDAKGLQIQYGNAAGS